jgi:hypothetical protein
MMDTLRKQDISALELREQFIRPVARQNACCASPTIQQVHGSCMTALRDLKVSFAKASIMCRNWLGEVHAAPRTRGKIETSPE